MWRVWAHSRLERRGSPRPEAEPGREPGEGSSLALVRVRGNELTVRVRRLKVRGYGAGVRG